MYLLHITLESLQFPFASLKSLMYFFFQMLSRYLVFPLHLREKAHPDRKAGSCKSSAFSLPCLFFWKFSSSTECRSQPAVCHPGPCWGPGNCSHLSPTSLQRLLRLCLCQTHFTREMAPHPKGGHLHLSTLIHLHKLSSHMSNTIAMVFM